MREGKMDIQGREEEEERRRGGGGERGEREGEVEVEWC